MAELQSSMPMVDLGPGDFIIIEAINPTTGAQVSGVTISGATLTYDVAPLLPQPELPVPLATTPGVNV